MANVTKEVFLARIESHRGEVCEIEYLDALCIDFVADVALGKLQGPEVLDVARALYERGYDVASSNELRERDEDEHREALREEREAAMAERYW